MSRPARDALPGFINSACPRDGCRPPALERVGAGGHPLARAAGAAQRGAAESLAALRLDGGAPPAEQPAAALPAASPPSASQAADDPLSLAAAAAASDPLSAARAGASAGGGAAGPLTASAAARVAGSRGGAPSEPPSESLRQWHARKSAVLSKFTGAGAVQLTSGAAEFFANSAPRGVEARLRALNQGAGGGGAGGSGGGGGDHGHQQASVSTSEYVERLRELNDEIAVAWQGADRAQALRLSVRVARLLSVAAAPAFYPALFVLVTDVMDTVGRMVYERLRGKAEREDTGEFVQALPAAFTARDVRYDCQHTTRNWFQRIGQVSDLLPRIYLEAAIVRCYAFIEEEPPAAHLRRLALMCRGLSDPLVAAYARAYVARRGAAAAPGERGYLEQIAADQQHLLLRLVAPGSPHGEMVLARAGNMDMPDYAALFAPALEWQAHCVVWAGTEASQPRAEGAATAAAVAAIHAAAAASARTGGAACASIVRHLVSVSPAVAVGECWRELLALVRGALPDAVPRSALWRALGERLAVLLPPKSERRGIVKLAWEEVASLSSLEAYLGVADAWIAFVASGLGAAEQRALLRDVSARLRKEGGKVQPNSDAASSLESLLFKALGGGGADNARTMADFASRLSDETVAELLAGFEGSSRARVCERLLEEALALPGRISDPVALHVLFEAGAALHDAVTTGEEVALGEGEAAARKAAQLCAALVSRSDLGRDAGAALSFLAGARGRMPSFEPVMIAAVHAARQLSARATATREGRRRAAAQELARAAAAFAHISVPSLEGIAIRADLMREAAGAALQASAVPQAEGLAKAAISTLAEAAEGDAATATDDSPAAKGAAATPAASPSELASCAAGLAGLLVAMPGHPHHGPFYLLRGLLSALQRLPWSDTAEGRAQHARALSACLRCCGALAQSPTPYRAEATDTNDVLYAAEPSYGEELLIIATDVATRALREAQAACAAGRAAPAAGRKEVEAAALGAADAVCDTLARCGGKAVAAEVGAMLKALTALTPGAASTAAYRSSLAKFVEASRGGGGQA